MKLRVVWFFSLLAIASVSAQQPTPPPSTGTGLILGRVVDAETSKPVAGVTVSISGGAGSGVAALQVAPSSGNQVRVVTDAQGRFVFHDLAATAFTVSASKPGYVAGAYGKRSPGGTGRTLELAAGEKRGDITLSLWKLGTIGGTITDETGEPMPGVQVRVLRRVVVAGRWQLTQIGNQPSTDDRGIYRIGSLAPGQYVVGVVSTVASAPASLQDAYAQAAQAGSTANFTRALDPSASVSSQPGPRRGEFVLQPGSQAPGGGVAAMPSLRPGRDDGPLFIYPTVFYPASPTAGQADAITLNPGEDRSNLDFRMRPVPSLTVSGIVTGLDGPSSGTSLQLLPSGIEGIQRDYSFETATAISDRSGAFTFFGVTPGAYTIRVLRVPPRPESTITNFTSVVQVGSSTIFSSSGPSVQPLPPNEPTWWATLPVSVGDANISGLSVVLRSGGRLGGHVEFDGTADKPTPDKVRQFTVLVEQSDGRTPGSTAALLALARGQVDEEGQLHTYQLPAGRYLVRVQGAAAPWTFAGAWLSGKDISAIPFDMNGTDVTDIVVKFTDRPLELSGSVRDDARSADVGATVLLFPADSQAWTDFGTTGRRFRTTETLTGGTYKFSGMAEGDYFVVAVREGLPTEWQDPSYLGRLAPVASRVTIGEGDKKVQDLRVSVVR